MRTNKDVLYHSLGINCVFGAIRPWVAHYGIDDLPITVYVPVVFNGRQYHGDVPSAAND